MLAILLLAAVNAAHAQWTSTDIGSVGVAGSDSYNSATGVYTLNGSGADIYGYADACHYVYQTLNGDGQLQARIVSEQNTNAAAKAGVMIRQSTSASAPELAMLETPSDGLKLYSRTTSGGATATTETSTRAAPYWVRVVKIGNYVSYFQSPDGVTWTLEGSVTYAWSGPVDLGLTVCSHVNTTLCTATFDNVSFVAQPSFAPPSPWLDQDIGAPSNAGAVQLQSPLWTIYSGGAGLTGTSDQFNFAYQPLSENGVIIAQVNSVSPSTASAGVVIRQDLTAGAAEAGVLCNSTGGISFITRATASASMVSVAGATSGTYWVELARNGNTFTGYQSTDGVTWTSIGSQTITMSGTIYAGIVGTSGSNSTLGFENLNQVQLWTGADVGSVGAAGSDSYGGSPGVYTLNGSGTAITGTADAFHYVYQTLSGDAELQARVLTVQNTTTYSRAGVMIRQSTAANAMNLDMMETPVSGVNLGERTTTGGTETNLQTSTHGVPYWVRVVRDGSEVSYFQSPDGVTWTFKGIVSYALTDPVDLGLAVCSHANTTLCTGTFDNVRLTQGLLDTDANGLPDYWEIEYFGATGAVTGYNANSDVDGNGFTLLQDYVGGADPTNYYSQPGPVMVTPTIAFASGTNGNNQTSAPSAMAPLPLKVQVSNSSGGLPLAGAPVKFTPSAGMVSATSGGSLVASVTVAADANGQALIYYQQPNSGNMTSTVTAATSGQSVGFTEMTQSAPVIVAPFAFATSLFPTGASGIEVPTGALLAGSDGNLYGTSGNYAGTVFGMRPGGTPTTLSSFVGTNGANPRGGVIQGSDGNFYGTTSHGGTSSSVGGLAGYSGYGTVFQMTPGGALTTLHAFTGTGTDGSVPVAGLVQGIDGKFYGTTQFGGSSNDGTVFVITAAGSLTTLHSFTNTGTDGSEPVAGVIQGTDGNFYGTTEFGGSFGDGTVFKVTPSGVLTTLYSFGGSDGSQPLASVIQGVDGNFYGTTSAGGAGGDGTVFKLTLTGTLTTLHAFSGSDGANPEARLVQASDGNFYGTTFYGGNTSYAYYPNGPETKTTDGTVFELTPGGVLTTLHFFSGNDGSAPDVALTPGNDGSFYGTTCQNSSSDAGTVFNLKPPSVSVAVGTSFTYQITATNNPTGFGVSGLPASVGSVNASGLIQGTPTVPGTYNVTVSATNSSGTGTGLLTVVVTSPVPVISSATSAASTIGAPFSYTISASNSPTRFSATGLPAGLSINPLTGAIYGTPTVLGNYSITISATNAYGTTSQNLALQIGAPAAISVVSGNGQTGPAGTFVPCPLVIKIGTGGVGSVNAPVTFSVSGGGGISLLSSGPVQTTLSTTTDASGEAEVYFQVPATANGSNLIMATATTATQVTSVTFTENATPGSAPQVMLSVSPTAANAPATATLTATIASGLANQVVFYEGSQLLGTVTSAPFTLALQNISAGIHSYTAVATNTSTGATGQGTAAFNGTVPGAPFTPYRYSRPSGSGIDPSFQTFVIALNQTAGALLAYTGNSSFSPSALPWFLRIANAVGYHLSVANSTVSANGITESTQLATYPTALAFQNPVVAFGAAGGGTALYTNQSYAFGIGSGGQDNAMTTLPDLRIRVFAQAALNANQSNVNPVATFYFTLPRQGTADWTTFAQNGFKRTYTLTQNGTTYPLVTTFQYQDFGNNPIAANIDNAFQFGSGQNSPFILTHTASSSAYYYEVDYEGVTYEQVGTPAGPNLAVPQELWMAMTNPSSTANQYSTGNSTGTYSLGYTLDFSDRPQQVSTFISQPQFQGQPLPPAYANMSVAELLNVNQPVTDQLAGVPVTTALTAIDGSPELREHPVLDKFVSDMTSSAGGNSSATAMALANYVLNNIHLTDALSYDRNGTLSDQSINCGGVNRGAMATYMEKEGNPVEQCALLIYLLRKAGIPCGYVFPANDTLEMLDQRMSSILRMQIDNAVDDDGNPIMPAGQLIPVNYPWVAAYLGGTLNGNTYSGGQWVHIFPWMKDTSITEGYDLNPLMPGPGVLSVNSTGYQSGFSWMQNYILRDPNILSLSSQWDDPAHLFVPFVEEELAAYHPTITIDDVGIEAFDRQNIYTSWSQFPQPFSFAGPLTPANFEPSLGQLDQTDQALSPPVGSIFNTVSLSLTTMGNGSGSAAPVAGIYPNNNGFETPNLGSSAYSFDPTGASWTFSGSAGIATETYALGATQGESSDSAVSATGQAAVLSGPTGSFTQSITLPAGTYSVAFGYEGNTAGGASNTIGVLLGGRQVFDGAPPTATSFTQANTQSVTLAAGTYSLTFSGVSSGGAVTYIDDVRVVPTLTLKAVDLHNRRLMVHEIKNATGPNYTMSLSLAPFRPGTTTVGQFSSADDMVNKQVLANSGLPIGDVVFGIQATYNRNLDMPRGFVQPSAGWTSFLGVHDTDTTVVASKTFFSGDLITYCLDFGRVTQQMLDIHAQNYWAAQQAVLNGSGSSVDPDDLLGEPLYMMGLSYDKATDDFTAQTMSLYKANVVSHLGYGVAKMNAVRTYQGALPNGVITLSYPAFDVADNEIADEFYQSAHVDTQNIRPTTDVGYLDSVGGSANEHTVINSFFNLTDSASTVHLLDVSQINNKPIAFLTSQNYLAQGNIQYTAPAIVSGTLSTATQPLSTWAGSQWSQIVSNFENSPYAFAYLTPGNVTCANGSFTGMGFLIGDGYGDISTLINFNQQQVPINGGTGQALPSPYNIAAVSTGAASPANWPLTFNGSFYVLNDLAPTSGAVQGFIAGSDATFSLGTDDQAIADGADVEDTFDTLANFNANLLFNDIPANSTLPTTGPALAAQKATIQNGGNLGQALYSALNVAYQVVADPVDVVAGAFHVDDTDLAMPGPLPIKWERHYNSLNTADNEFGYGWLCSYEPYLVVSSGNSPVIYAAEMDGSVIAYSQQVVNNQTEWIPLPANNPTLMNQRGAQSGGLTNLFNNVITLSGNTYTLKGADGSVRTYVVQQYPLPSAAYGASRSRPYLTTWQDPQGNILTFTIGNNNTLPDYGKLNRIASSNGNYIQLDYDNYGHVLTATASDGRQTSYTYDSYGDLTSVTRADGSEVAYTYDTQPQTVNGVTQAYSDHLLTQVTKPEGRVLQNFYVQKSGSAESANPDRRVDHQKSTIGSNGALATGASFAYANSVNSDGTLSGTTTVTDALGRATTYAYSENEITSITYPAPLNYTVQQTWYQTTNTSGAYNRSLQQRTDRRGLVTRYLYDTSPDGNANPANRGNPTEIDSVGDLTGSGAGPETDTKYIDYNNQNLPIQITDKNTDATSGNYTTFAYASGISPYLCTLLSAYTANGLISQTSYLYQNVGSGAEFANGMLQTSVVAQNTSDAAETDYGYTTQGYVASETQQTGTSDPPVAFTFSYNPSGEVVQKKDAAGRYSQMAYDAMGRIISDNDYDQSGDLLSFHNYIYNQNGELQWTQGPHFDPDDYTYRTYDGAGRLTQLLEYRSQAIPGGSGVEQATGNGFIGTTSHVYDTFGDEVVTMDANGNTMQSPTASYDVLGRLLSRQYQDNAATPNVLATESYTYEPGDKIATYVNALGGETQYFYTSTGQIKEQINPDGTTESWTYQCDGRLHQATYANGATRTLTYDDLNRVVTSSYNSTSGSLSATESEGYDRRGNLVARTDADGYTTATAYDGLDRVIAVTGPPAGVIPSLGSSSQADAGGGDAQQQITYSYDAAGIRELAVNALGERTVTTYDGLHRPTQVNICGAQGQTVRTTSYAYAPNFQSVTTIDGVNGEQTVTYNDVQGNPVLVVKGDGGSVYSTYDPDENLVSSTDELNRTTTYSYDGLNRETQEQLPDGAKTNFSYDLTNRILTRSMPGGLTWSATFDPSARQLSEQLVQGSNPTPTRTSQFSYYPTGELYQVTDPRGIVSTYNYDGFDRVHSINAVDASSAKLGVTQTYGYDFRGDITELDQAYQNPAFSSSNSSVLRSYDGYGHIAEEQTYLNGIYGSTGALFKDKSVETRDGAGRRSQLGVVDEINNTVQTYGYSFQADDSLTGTSFNGYNFQYTYGLDGLLSTRTTPWSTLNVVSRDPAGRILEQKQSGPALLLDENITWRTDSTQSSYSAARTGGVAETRSYGYDDASGGRGHLLSESFAPASGQTASLAYQFDGNTTGGLGQRTSASLTGAIAGTNTSTYASGSYARLTQQTLSGSQLPASGFSPVNDLYDPTGQLSTHSPGSNSDTLTWDAFGRLISMQRNPTGNGFSWTAIYDGFGRRLQTTQQTIAGGVASGAPLVTQSTYDPETGFLELASTVNGKRQWLVHGPDLSGDYGDLEGTGGVDAVITPATSSQPNGTAFGVISDVYGHAEATISGTGGSSAVTWNPVRCTGYGPEPGASAQPLDGVHDLSTLLAWRGKYIDGTGFYYLGNRYYDPSSGTFISCDPLGHDGSMDLYSYAEGDPVNNFDPDGNCAESAYNGGSGSAMLRDAGSYLNDIAPNAPNPALAFSTSYVGGLMSEVGNMTPHSVVDAAFQYGSNVESEDQQYGFATASEYAATSWNVGAIEAAAFNINPVTAEPVGSGLERFQVGLGGVAGTASILGPWGFVDEGGSSDAFFAETPIKALDGPHDSEILDDVFLDRVGKILERNKVTFLRGKSGDNILDLFGGKELLGTFIPGKKGDATLAIRSNATKYILYHELKHWADFRRLGYKKFVKQTPYEAEKSVYQYLRRQKWMNIWERQDAYTYFLKHKP